MKQHVRIPSAEEITAAKSQVQGLRDQARRDTEMIDGLALIQDAVDHWDLQVPDAGLPVADSHPLVNLRDGLHILLTAWGRKLAAERALLQAQADFLDHSLRAAESGIVVPR